MALEISEIAIQMRVRDGAAPQPGDGAAGGGPGPGGAREGSAEEARTELVEECVRRVLAALNARKAR